jgi:exodeoxyribonuclease VII small subunit
MIKFQISKSSISNLESALRNPRSEIGPQPHPAPQGGRFPEERDMSDDGEIGFEAALEELEAIVGELERGRPDLGTALARYERGVRLLGHCQGLLDGAERSVALLTGVDEAGRPITAPFDASATATSSEKKK